MRPAFVILFGAALFMPFVVAAQPYELDIRSDTLNIDNASDHAVFEGNVVVIHEGMTLTADKVDVFYKETDKDRSVDEVKAYGNVQMKRDDRVARGKRAVYSPGSERVTLYEDVKVTQGEDQALYGTKMLYDLASGRITMSSEGSRVRARLGVENEPKKGE